MNAGAKSLPVRTNSMMTAPKFGAIDSFKTTQALYLSDSVIISVLRTRKLGVSIDLTLQSEAHSTPKR